MTTPAKELKPVKTYKDRMFRMIFSEKEKLLELYNAVSGKNYEDPELLTINTLENAIYMSMKNDISFLIDSRLSLYEHQSTYNPNMPLRLLHYISDLYESMVNPIKLYGSSPVQIPPPRFIVFYNGTEERPEREELCLSRLYSVEEEEIWLELKVVVLNINMGHNKELMEACRTLWEYAEYVRRVRQYRKEMSIEEAVERAITECIAEGILREFLIENRAEAKAVSIYEYSEEEHIRMEREDAFEDGRKSGIEQEKINTNREKERADTEKERADTEKERADTEKERADTEKERADIEKQRADKALNKVKDMEAEIQKLRQKIGKYEGGSDD
ncbi:MAG: hypothetical protein SPJ92_07780 [Bariatricus sp.]|nr:hypothetical protein [Bariatricus sp.]